MKEKQKKISRTRKSLTWEEKRAREIARLKEAYHTVRKSIVGDPKYAAEAGLFGSISEDEWVKDQMIEFDRENFLVPDKIFKDWSQTVTALRKKFLQYLPELAPDELEELRALSASVPDCIPQIRAEVFMSEIGRLRNALFDCAVNVSANRASDQYRKLDRKYLWAEYRTLLDELANYHTSDSLQSEHTQYANAAKIFKDVLGIQVTSESDEIARFARTMTGLIKWADTYHCGRDWVVEQLLFCAAQIRLCPEMDLRKLQFAVDRQIDFEGAGFSFKFPGWSPGKEKPSEFKDRLRRKLSVELDKHLRETYLRLDLSSAISVTKPINTERTRWLVMWNINKWAAGKIADEYNKESEKSVGDSAIYEGIRDLEKYGFPVR